MSNLVHGLSGKNPPGYFPSAPLFFLKIRYKIIRGGGGVGQRTLSPSVPEYNPTPALGMQKRALQLYGRDLQHVAGRI